VRAVPRQGHQHGDRFMISVSPTALRDLPISAGGPKFTPNNFNHGETPVQGSMPHAEVTCRSGVTARRPSDFERFAFTRTRMQSCHVHAGSPDDEHPWSVQELAVPEVPPEARA